MKITKYLVPIISTKGNAVAWILMKEFDVDQKNFLECSLYFS